MRSCHLTCCAVVLAMGLLPVTRAQAAPRSSRAVLQSVVSAADLKDVALTDAIQFIRDVSNLNLIVDWKTLESINVSKDTQINLSMHNVKIQTLLKLILSEAAGGNDLLTFYIDQNVVHVTTREEADSVLITVVYYVDDLLGMQVPFTPQAQQGNVSAQSGSFTGGGSTSITGNVNANTNGINTQSKQQYAQTLITMIQELVRPMVWRVNGGKSDIEYFNGSLIVTAPRSVQEAIGGPLD